MLWHTHPLCLVILSAEGQTDATQSQAEARGLMQQLCHELWPATSCAAKSKVGSVAVSSGHFSETNWVKELFLRTVTNNILIFCLVSVSLLVVHCGGDGWPGQPAAHSEHHQQLPSFRVYCCFILFDLLENIRGIIINCPVYKKRSETFPLLHIERRFDARGEGNMRVR